MKKVDPSVVKTLLKKVQRLARGSQIPEDMLKFYVHSLSLQGELPMESLNAETMDETTGLSKCDPKRLPLYKVSELELHTGKCLHVLSSLLDLSMGINDVLTSQSGKIKELMKKDHISSNLFKAAATGRSEEIRKFAEEEDVDEGVLFFVLRASVKAVLSPELKSAAGGKDLSLWNRGFCPICGSQPHFSYLSEDQGKRITCCSFCGHKWRMDRLFCPFCENKDTDSLLQISLKEYPGLRVDVCGKCRQYVKVMDLREMEGTSVAVLDDLGTLFLDFKMAQEKYTRPVPVPA